MTRLVAALLLLTLTAVASGQGGGAGSGGLTALPNADQAGANLVVNGGFETAIPAGGPEGWTTSGSVWTLDPAAHSGRAALKLSGAETQRQVPAAEQRVTLEPGFYTLGGWVKASGLGAGSERSGVRLCLDGRPRLNWWKCTDMVRGTLEWKQLTQPLIGVTDAGPYRVTVGSYGLPDGQAWFDDVSLVRVGRGALDVYLLYPNYRGLLFDDRPQTVRVAVGVAEDARARSPRARTRLALVDEQGGAVRVQREVPASSRTVAELDAGPLPQGAFRLRAELVADDGEVLQRYPDYRIVKLPASARKRYAIWYDEGNVAWLHGRPSFVLGLYTTSGYTTSRDTYARGHDDGWGVQRMAEAPINMLINYWLGATPVPALEVYMDELSSRGIYYLQTVNFYYADHPQYKTLPYPAAREGDEALNRWVARTLVGHRGLAGFYTADERPADVVPRVFRQHRTMSDAAPGTVTYAVLGDGWENQAPLWRDALDVMGLDPYPIAKPGQNDLAMVGEWTRMGRDAVQGSRPLWMVMQYFPLTSAAGWPTYEQVRTMSWMAIIDGATGLFYWSYGNKGLAWIKDRAAREAKWKELVRITKEIKALEGVLLAPDAAVVAGDSSGGAIRALGKRGPDGVRYLFAYNARNAPVRVTWTLADPAREARELDGGAVGLEGAKLSAEFNPYEVKRYRIQ